MIEQPSVVDCNGDIHLHGRQGLQLPVEFADANGTLRDMSGASVVFEVGPDINVNLTPVPGVASQMLLTLTQADVKAIADSRLKDFVFLETSAAVPTPVWRGVVYVTGWTE